MPPSPDPSSWNWAVVIPMKAGRESKRRLVRPDRELLSRAFGEDTLRACRHCPRVASVHVVSPELFTTGAGVTHVDDPGTGLNDAITAAIGSLPDGTPVAVVVADLPCLTSDALSAVLDEAQSALQRFPAAAVPDRQGTGTTMLLGFAPGLCPNFGVDSLRRHRDGGAAVLRGGLRTRLDVDDESALTEAVGVGVGQSTTRVLATPSEEGP